MRRMISVVYVLVLSLGLLSSVSATASSLFAQQNQTSNMTSMQEQQPGQQQQNQTTGIGTAGEMENLTAGNIPLLQNESSVESQNDTSLIAGLQKEQTTTDTNMTANQTGGGITNGTTNQTGAQGGADEQQGNQTEKGPIEQIGEAISGMFGGGNQSN